MMPILASHVHVSPSFSHLDIANKMVQLTMPSVSCELELVPTASHDQKIHSDLVSNVIT